MEKIKSRTGNNWACKLDDLELGECCDYCTMPINECECDFKQ